MSSPSPNGQTKQKGLLRPVSAPLSSTRLTRLIYLLVALSAALSAYYAWRVTQWKTDVGGWWNLVMGVPPKSYRSRGESTGNHDNSVESHIYALALSLGVPAPDLAKAIAGAVRAYVPPASLTALSEVAQATDGNLSPVLEELLNGSEANLNTGDAAGATAADSPGVVDNVVSGIGTFVGMDEP